MRRLNVAALIILLVGAVNCFADIVPISSVPTNRVPLGGTGYGNVLTLLNAQDSGGGQTDDGLEANCDIVSGGVAVSSCSGPFSSLTLNDPGNQNHAQSIAATGITDSTTAASQLQLVFNINQTGSSQAITLQDIGLALWVGDTNIFSALSARTDTYTTIEQGNGQSGFAYELDATQAAAAQTAIDNAIAGGATLSTILVTGAFQAGCPPPGTCANDGAETLFLQHQKGSVSVPDGGVTLMLLGGVLVGIESLRRKLRV
jgi:hypothetical protein